MAMRKYNTDASTKITHNILIMAVVGFLFAKNGMIL